MLSLMDDLPFPDDPADPAEIAEDKADLLDALLRDPDDPEVDRLIRKLASSLPTVS